LPREPPLQSKWVQFWYRRAHLFYRHHSLSSQKQPAAIVHPVKLTKLSYIN
jgi:hypothetical protein